uniref:EF-Hand, Calmodulin n=1 Tax=Rhodopseudomonas palustris (strain DX-1) TaxID=652103 RepID=E6VIE0_RHOPX
MLPALGALGALSGLLNTLSASTSKSSKQTTGFTNPFESSSGSTGTSSFPGLPTGNGSLPSSGLSPQTMQALLDAQSAQSTGNSSSTASKSRDAALKDLFKQIDGNGDGAISKGEFEDALGAGGTNIANADKVFSKLDSDGDGSVTAEELASALMPRKQHDRSSEEARKSGRGGGSSDPLLQALSGSSSTSVANSDGSVTTSISYADGTKVTMTSAATGSSSSGATSSYNFIEQLIQRQAAQIQAASGSSLSVSA